MTSTLDQAHVYYTAQIDALRLALAGAEERAKTAESLQGERGRCLRIAAFYERHNGDDDAWEMCAQYIANDIRGGQEPLTDEECVAKIFDDASKVNTLEADLSRAVEQCLEQQKLLDEYKAVHVAVCAERDDLQARRAELEKALMTIRDTPWENGENEAFRRGQSQRQSSAFQCIARAALARSAIAPAPGEGE